MKNPAQYSKRLSAVLRQFGKGFDVPSQIEPTDPVEQLVQSFLLWETTRRQAEGALGRITRAVVDFNDLRVTDPRDLARIIGPRISRGEERAQRLHSVLEAIYQREHGVTLERLTHKSKRDARAYLDKLEGMVPFVSASVLLLSLGGHAVVLDSLLLAQLRKDEVVDAEADEQDVQAFLEHHIRAADAVRAHYLFRAYLDHPAKAARLLKAKTTKKTTTAGKKKSTRSPSKR